MISKRASRYLLTVILAVFSLLVFSPRTQAVDVPKFLGYVNDYANMMSPDSKTQIEEKLKALEQTDSTQIVVLTVQSLEGEAIEDFGIKVAEAWKIGQKDKDNGVILIAAKQDKRIRIEVGQGLEGKLTDLEAGRIIDLVIKPLFKKGDFDSGFMSGVDALIASTKGEFSAAGTEDEKEYNYIVFIISLIVCCFIAFFAARTSPLHGIVAGFFGGSVSALLSGMSDAAVVLKAAVFGVAATTIVSGLAWSFSKKGRKGTRSSVRRSGSYSSDRDSGFSSSSSSSDSSDSGGGGEFGGGGSSGSWD